MHGRWLDDLTLSDETSLSLLDRAQRGDAVALEALMGRYLARLQRWAAGRLPARGRSVLDTDDIVQDALLNTLKSLNNFKPRHDGALLAYLRTAVANRIRNELRRVPLDVDSSLEPDSIGSDAGSPFDQLVNRQSMARYEAALAALDENERAAIIGRFEMGYSYDALARSLARPSADAARKLTERALRRLLTKMQPHDG